MCKMTVEITRSGAITRRHVTWPSNIYNPHERQKMFLMSFIRGYINRVVNRQHKTLLPGVVTLLFNQIENL